MNFRPGSAFAILFIALLAASCVAQTIDVDITPAHETNRFIPNQTLGAGIDRISVEAIDKDLTPAALKPAFTAGWGPVRFREISVVFVQGWYVNMKGTWRAASGQGFFTWAAACNDHGRYYQR